MRSQILEQTLESILNPIRQDLSGVELKLEEILACQDPLMDELVQHVKQFRGKRLRPSLVLLSGQLCATDQDIKNQDTLLTLAAVVELIHTATLIHDDIIDQADTRRQLKSFNSKWDNQTAVIFGDYLFAHAFDLTCQFEDPRIRKRLGQVTIELCRGEMMQLGGRDQKDLSTDSYMEMITNKTATFIGGCAQMGAWCAGAPDKHSAALGSYGLNLGLAFQIVDDCLDLVGQEARMGKSLGTDVATGKFTLPLIKLLERLDESTRDTLLNLLRQGQGSEAKQSIIKHPQLPDAVQDAMAMAKDLGNQANQALSSLPPSSIRDTLENLTDFIIQRDC